MASSATPTPPGNWRPAHSKVLGDPSYGMAVVAGSAPRQGVREGGNRLQAWLPLPLILGWRQAFLGASSRGESRGHFRPASLAPSKRCSKKAPQKAPPLAMNIQRK